MSVLHINGGNPLNGKITVQGSKNSALPILAASLLVDGQSVIHNCPNISDVDASIRILEFLGCKCSQQDGTIVVDSSTANGCLISDALLCEMRSSVTFLGAMLAKCGRAQLSAPGGCELGLRPINLHIESLRKMGAIIYEHQGKLICSAPNGLVGCSIDLPIASVGTTENIMIAASTAHGVTLIRNAAKEPEITDLANYLRGCGAHIFGDGGTVIKIEGVSRLNSCEHTVIPDRIVAATYISAVAVCSGEVKLLNALEHHLHSVLPFYEQMGCDLDIGKDYITIRSFERLKKVSLVRTGEYPGFPTDAQPILLAATCLADGTSVFVENIFSNRYRYVSELIRMGADINVIDRVAVVNGVRNLMSAKIDATDLRGGAAMVICALAANGQSKISSVCHIDRGYENIEGVLNSIGADVIRER